MRRILRGLLATPALLPASAGAHPGHGSSNPGSATHYLLEPIHAVPLGVLLLTFSAVWLMRRFRPARLAEEDLTRQSPAGQIHPTGTPHSGQ